MTAVRNYFHKAVAWNGPIPHIINVCFNDWNRKNRIKKLIFHILEEKIMVVNVPTLV